MPILTFNVTAPLPPIARKVCFFDKVQIWVDEPLTKAQIDPIRRHSGRIHVRNQPMQYHPEWPQRLQINQPTPRALRILYHSISGYYLINGIEVAIDFIPPAGMPPTDIENCLRRHLTQMDNRLQQLVIVRGTFYSGPRKRKGKPNPRRFVIYSDRDSKITGDPCCHVEWRIQTASAVVDAGLDDLQALIHFVPSAFWAEWLPLVAIDPAGYFRALTGSPRRKSELRTLGKNGPTIDFDAMRGKMRMEKSHVAVRGAPTDKAQFPRISTQAVLNHARKLGVSISRAVKPLPNAHFVP